MHRPIAVLFIDDEPAILRAIRRSLLGYPFDVLTASTGTEAIAILEARPVDVVVSDLEMPEMSGLELLRIVRERWPRVLRMVLTATATFGSTLEAINECEIVHFFPKLFDAEAFARVLARFEPRIGEHRGEEELAALAAERVRRLRAMEARFPGILDVVRDDADRVVVDVPARLAAASAAGSTAAVLFHLPSRGEG